MLLAMSNEGRRNASEFLGPGACSRDMNSTFGQTHISPLSGSSFHRKEAQAHRLNWSCDKFWPFPDLSKWRSRELSHTSPGTYKSDWVWALGTGKKSLGGNFMSASIWVFWNPYIFEIDISLTSNSARKIEGTALFSNISTRLVYAWIMT